ncbi:hypothetical protein [Martelella soudanensis]|uniref:hypothetical protein n=1 Tax=unclassified Martelella TaxID=2629616 RepID=UPI0015DDD0BA|nr:MULTISPECIES: hypothetical protein [unclassified Martelella]
MKTLAQFFDHLPLLPMRWEIQRNDELSGIGSGVVFQAELATPLWSAAIALQPVRLPEANEISALVNGLAGAQEPFLFRDPYICGPKLDPQGAGLGGVAVTVSAANGRSLSLEGMPAGYRLSIGDKIQIIASGGTHAFVEVSENVVATAGGTTGSFQVFPRLPVSVSAGASCSFARPACPCIILPGSFQSGTPSGNIVTGIAFRIVQKRGVQ